MNAAQKAVKILCLGELIERFSYFGLFTVLVLKLTSFYHLSDQLSFTILAVFTALSYAMLLLGGYVADRWLGNKHSIILGSILLIAGDLLLASAQLHLFYLGLSVIVMGTALFKVNSTSLIGHIYKNDDLQRERTFTIFYSCMNIGGTLGPICYGILIAWIGWSYCFIVSAVLIALVLILILANRFLSTLSEAATSKAAAYISSAAIIALVFFGMLYANLSNELIILLFVISFALLIKTSLQQERQSKRRLFALLILNLSCSLFFACSMQVAGSITLFVQRSLNRNIFGTHVPTSVFSALDPLFVVLAAPVFVLIWKSLAKKNILPNASKKTAIGIALAALAFVALYIAATQSITNQVLSIIATVIAYLFLGAGEISMSPAVLTSISKLSPSNLKSTMTGSWFLFAALGAYLAGQLSKLSDHDPGSMSKAASLHIYEHTFLIVALLAIIAAAAVWGSSKVVKRLSC